MPESRSARIPVVVTGVGGGGFGEQILKALRLAETSYEVIATDTTPLSRGFARADHRYVVPPATDPRYIETLLAICQRHSAKAVFAGSEPELLALARSRAEIEQSGILLPINPDHVLETCLDKYRTMQFLRESGFPTPMTVRVEDEAALGAIDFFPMILKPYVGGGGSADVYLAQDREELLALGRYLLAGDRKLIAQEYVGTSEREFTVGVLTSMNGEFINSIAVKRFTLSGLSTRVKVRNKTGRAQLGQTLVISSGISQGEVGTFPEITGPCEAIAMALGSRGPLNIQCRLVEGQVVAFEINPRFSGTTSLRAMVGYNEPDVLIREHLLGDRTVRRFPYGTGVILRGLDETLVEQHDVGTTIALE